SRPHCWERSGSAAPNAGAAAARQARSEKTNASGVRMRRLCPGLALSSQIGGPPMNNRWGRPGSCARSCTDRCSRSARSGWSHGPSLRTLRGTTGQGFPVKMTMGGRHVHAFDIKWISARCKGGRSLGTYWTPSIGQANLRYQEHGERIDVHEWPNSVLVSGEEG